MSVAERPCWNAAGKQKRYVIVNEQSAAGRPIELLELPPWRALVSRYLGFMGVVKVGGVEAR
jgi:hypothetical protein